MLFAVHCGVVQIVCYLLTKAFAPLLLPNYSSTPPFPKHLKVDAAQYRKLGDAVGYKHKIDIASLDLQQLAEWHCGGKLTTKNIASFLRKCNQYHTDIAKSEKRIQECLFPILTKGITFMLGMCALGDKEWLYDRSLFYKGWPYDQQLDCCVPDIKLLYMFHVGWYIYKLFAQALLDRHLKDFMASMIHHFAAIALLALSYNSGVVRVGVAVLLLHDPADIVLQSAKLFRIFNWSLPTNVCFAVLVVTWFLTRIVIFPYHCVLSGFIYFKTGHFENDSDSTVILACCLLMCALCVLHLHWFWIIIQAVIRAISGKGTEDPRESDVSEMEDNLCKPELDDSDD